MANTNDNLKRVGGKGEWIVRAHLERLGWRVLETNYRCSLGEIDLIAVAPEAELLLVFIEVKTRRGTAHGTPLSAVGARKQARIAAVANHYLGTRDGGPEPHCRFDIAEVVVDPSGMSLVRMHIGAFTA